MKDPENMKLGYPCPYCNRGSCYALENENGAVRCFRCSRSFFFPALSKWQALVKAYRSKVDKEECERHGRLMEVNAMTGEKTCWVCAEEDLAAPLRGLTSEQRSTLFNMLKARIDKSNDFEEWSNCGHE